MSPSLGQCVKCHKKRRGRYTQPHGSRSVQMWHCYVCLPEGQGNDEGPTPPTTAVDVYTPVAKKKGKLATTTGDNLGLDALKAKAAAYGGTVLEDAKALELVTAEDFKLADILLGEVGTRQKGWGSIWTLFYDISLRKVREGLEAAYELNRSVTKPMEEAEKVIKAKMKVWRRGEDERIAQADRKRVDEAQQLEAQIEQTEARIQTTTKPLLRTMLMGNLSNLQDKQAEVFSNTPERVETAHSEERERKRPAVTNLMLFATAVHVGQLKGNEQLHIDLAEALEGVLRKQKKGGADIYTWPGVEEVSEWEIAKK